MIRETERRAVSGFGPLGLGLAVLGLCIYGAVQAGLTGNGRLVLGSLLLAIADILLLCGLFVVNPNEGRVLQLFGSYVGTVRQPGLRWANPFYTKRRLSLRVRNFESARLKVNDTDGNPIEIASVVVWRVVDTAEASFEGLRVEQHGDAYVASDPRTGALSALSADEVVALHVYYPFRHDPPRARRSAAAFLEQIGRSPADAARFTDRLQPLPRILLEAAPQQLAHPRRRVRRQRVPFWLARDHRRHRIRRRFPGEHLLARQHLEQHNAKRPHVRATVDRFPARLLRRHIRRRPQNHSRPCRRHAQRRRVRQIQRRRRFFRQCLRQSKIQHFHLPVAGELDVRRLQIAMYDSAFVCILQRLRNLLGNRQRLV